MRQDPEWHGLQKRRGGIRLANEKAGSNYGRASERSTGHPAVDFSIRQKRKPFATNGLATSGLLKEAGDILFVMTADSQIPNGPPVEANEDDFTASGELTPTLSVLCALFWAVSLPYMSACALLEHVGLKKASSGLRDFSELTSADPGPRKKA